MVFVRLNFFIWFWAFWPSHSFCAFSRSLARRRCVGVYFRAMSMEWNEETGGNNQTTKRFPKYLSAQITCLLMILQSWLAIFMRNCGILQICESSIRYHAMCFVQCTLACACARWYAKITINTYCVTYNLCIRGWFVFCALVCLSHSFFFFYFGAGFVQWNVQCHYIRAKSVYTFKYVHSRKI